jgi:hypothetical protein
MMKTINVILVIDQQIDLHLYDVPPNTIEPELANDAVADADTAATILPYLDFLVIKSKLVPFVFNTVVNHSS